MLTKEENDLLTRVGPGTPAGELLRRYWHPVAVVRELTDESPTKFVRILGEDLVLFRDKTGRVGLLADHCSHRGASLLYGRVEERGIACAYHGWLYDVAGGCLECPAEPSESRFHLTVKHTAYPVQKLCGMYWAYLGPPPAPAIPRYDVWVRRDGRHRIGVHPIIDCNWFQAMENSADSSHLQILHQDLTGHGRTPPSTTRGFVDDIASYDYSVFPHGIMKRWAYRNGLADEHPLLFPTILRVNNSTEIRVPIDDTHTMIFEPYFYPTADGRIIEERDDDIEVSYSAPYKEPADALHPFTRFTMDRVPAQDIMTWETQGPIANREVERLGASDWGVVLLRQVMKEQIERVQQGLDPLGVIRNPDHLMIDTKLQESLGFMMQRGVPMQVAELTPI